METDRLQDIEAYTAEIKDRLVRDIARMVAVPSVEEPSRRSDAQPFGPGPDRALEEILAIARELGLETKNCEHYLGYAQVGGDGGRYLAAVTHVDVVPAEEGWKADPFILREQEGYLLGRGVMDDKGPAVLTLYALKYLQDRGIPLRYPVRALFGANEETGMKDVEYYLAHYPAPLFAFSPDADFPLINGEKGVYHAVLRSRHLQQGNVIAIRGGTAANVIPAKADAVLRVPPEKAVLMTSTEWVTAEQTAEDIWQLKAVGIGGHASVPEGTVNAIGKLIEYILERELGSRKETAYFRFLQKIHQASDGSAADIAADDGRFDPLTAEACRIWQEEDTICQTIDIRYPTNTDADTLTAQLLTAGAGAVLVKDVEAQKPFWRDPASPELTACMEAYREITGERTAQAFSIGGGTYAKDFPNAVAFGPEHPERKKPSFVGYIHGGEEGASLEELLEALKIYIAALLRLEQLDF